MTRTLAPTNALLLGFDDFERLIDRAAKQGSEGFPPYNIERVAKSAGRPELLRITLAVAGFPRESLDVQIEDKQLVIRGKQESDPSRTYIYRGIAARQFCRTFVLASGLEVAGARLDNGLLSIDLVRLEPDHRVRSITIAAGEPEP